MTAPPSDQPSRGGRRIGRYIAGGVVIAVLSAGGWFSLRNGVSLDTLAEHEQTIRGWRESDPLWVYPIAFVLYVLILSVSLPGASVLTPTLGWYFGFWEGVVMASFASTAGATLAFLVSRYLLRATIERRFAKRLESVNAALEREGPYYLATLRMVPICPFFIINLVMGVTRMPVWTFWWVSQLGMLPATCLFVYVGSSVPTLSQLAHSTRPLVSWQLLAALTALGLLPLGLRFLLKLVRKEPPPH